MRPAPPWRGGGIERKELSYYMQSSRRSVRTVSATLAGGLLLAASALVAAHTRAQGEAPVAMTLYRGESIASSNIRLASWGSGRAEESKENVLSGDTAIKVTTHGLYQGARLDFKNPIDLSAALSRPGTYLRFQARFNSQTGGLQNNFNPFSLETSQKAASPFDRIRFLLVMADGKQYELIRPADIPPSEDIDSYVPIAFPLAAVAKAAGKTLTGDSARLKSLAIFGDKYQQFQVGEISVLTDETEISIAPLDDQIAFTDDEMTFVGSAEGGAGTLRFCWDWDARDGIQEDSIGRAVTHVFKKPGKYTITLTVKDEDGLKKSHSVTLELDVAGSESPSP